MLQQNATRTAAGSTTSHPQVVRPREGLAPDRLASALDAPSGRQPAPDEEMLVPDDRAGLSPSQAVETKLVGILAGATVPFSQLQGRALRWGR